ncbi:glycosyltransferase family 9 protein [Bdellovibrio bacteriovorus]|uniref:glycosyltransferase family 9 protein n=1 Tax=Bdellovibrio bacteriovorus TaxID=959 RepID=UPI0035A62B97
MKILVLSLLRLGDIIQQEPLLRALREKYPEAQIHLLVNRQFAQVEKLMHGLVDRYIHFDREMIQRGLGESGFNIMWSFTQVQELVNSLNAERYDLALNFTHNKLSGYLLGALEVPQKKGLYHAEGRFRGLDNRWIRYFNERFSGSQKSLFHYVELLGSSFDLPVQPQAKGEKKRSKRILFQCLTSNEKKNWGLEHFAQLKRTIEVSLVDYKVQILGASFEKETLLQAFAEKDLLICDLNEARRHLQESALLVTGDTSIKHLAAQLGTPIVELVLGSSDATKTGAFVQGARILTTQVPCAPCGYSSACSQPSHLCAQDISVEKVFESIWDELSDEKLHMQQFGESLEKATWKTYLDQGKTSLLTVMQGLLLEQPKKGSGEILSHFAERTALYQQWQQRIEAALPSRELMSQKQSVQASEMADLVLVAQEIVRSKKDEAGYFQGFVEALIARYTQPVQIVDRVQTALQEQGELLTIRENIYRHLQSLSREGAYYAKGIGQLPISGFEEAGKSIQRNPENAEL